ncbi:MULTISPECIES: LacI family DNA-binding transcriptional regulator [Bacillaceae]|uniref:LacI family DNA-binding transcriptional regulator n=1 Tax=Metabacillus sediminis TaxID=3117746 RepID=A0ABZ2NH05_9BACI|nr:LacI family DNA-binding transcriptional regulator [Bacillus sp. SJS]KZZ84934.1 LacI family transcriptional regulator [Bacillus sp. SJS]
MATITDVANLAGLSRSTVSRVMNNYPYVSEEKKRLVEEAMKKLNYYPNSSAQTLRSQKTDTIAVFIPMLTNPFFSYLLEGIDAVATENGFRLLVCQTRYDRKTERQFFNLVKSKQVDGIILTSIENDWSTVRDYMSYGPVVMCNEYDHESNTPNVRLDQVYGGYIGTRHLIDKGHKKIAFCQGSFRSFISKAREAGYRLAMKEAGLQIRDEYAFRIAADYHDGKEVLKKIAAMVERPTAIFTGSDQVAAGIVYEARHLGINVPEDLAVIGFDDQPIAEMTLPQLTTIRQPAHEIGERAMKLMLNLVLPEEDAPPMPEEPLKLEIIERSST